MTLRPRLWSFTGTSMHRYRSHNASLCLSGWLLVRMSVRGQQEHCRSISKYSNHFNMSLVGDEWEPYYCLILETTPCIQSPQLSISKRSLECSRNTYIHFREGTSILDPLRPSSKKSRKKKDRAWTNTARLPPGSASALGCFYSYRVVLPMSFKTLIKSFQDKSTFHLLVRNKSRQWHNAARILISNQRHTKTNIFSFNMQWIAMSRLSSVMPPFTRIIRISKSRPKKNTHFEKYFDL